MATPGKRAAPRPTSRRTPRATIGEPLTGPTSPSSRQARRGLVAATTSTSRGLLWPAVGITLAIVGWGSLVFAAIDFGARGRAGETGAWLMLALSSLGAVVCLFAALLLAARIFQRVQGSTGADLTAPGLPRASRGPRAGQRAASARAATSGPEPTTRLDLAGDPTGRTQPLTDPLADPLWGDLPAPSQPGAPSEAGSEATPQGAAGTAPRPRHAGGHRAG